MAFAMLAMMASMSGGIVASPSYTVCACLPSTASAARAAESAGLRHVHATITTCPEITLTRAISDGLASGGRSSAHPLLAASVCVAA